MEEVNRPCPTVCVHSCPHSCSAYSILSGFTLALLEDSGWYQANYTVAERTVNGDGIPLLYGKGVCGVCVWLGGCGVVCGCGVCVCVGVCVGVWVCGCGYVFQQG